MPDGSYFISDILHYFEYIIKKHETIAHDPRVQIYTNKVKNRIVFKVKKGYILELLSPETMKDAVQDKNGQDVPKLESIEVVLVRCNGVNKNYQQAYKVLFTFVPNRQFCQ